MLNSASWEEFRMVDDHKAEPAPMYRALRNTWGLRKSPHLPILALLVVNLCIGLAIGNEYGESYDEEGDSAYGWDAIHSYRQLDFDWEGYGKRKYYGPLAFAVSNLAGEQIGHLLPEWSAIDGRHFVYFMFFQVAIVSFFSLASRFGSRLAATVGTLLFSTQPLLFGHGFINGKDIPFLGLFLGAMAVGWAAADRAKLKSEALREPNLSGAAQELRDVVTRSWRDARWQRRSGWILSIAMLLLVVFELYLNKGMVLPWIRGQVELVYRNAAWPPLNRLFAMYAEQAGTAALAGYVLKASALYNRLRFLAVLISAMPLMILGRTLFGQAREIIWDRRALPMLREWHQAGLLTWFILSGALAGFATSIRVFGLFAGVLVSLLVLVVLRRRAIGLLAFYWMALWLSTILTWPYLWSAPLGHLVESVQFMADNPWRGYVTYMGAVWKGRLLPWHYIPVLMAVQFTEPAVVLGGSVP